jgi:3-methyladenine DNA glycosylase/8-oxoguanine DNA glycosylase
MTTKFIEFMNDVDCAALDAQRLDDLQKIELAGYRVEYEERSAIYEYDGGLSRAEADQRAAEEIIKRYKL